MSNSLTQSSKTVSKVNHGRATIKCAHCGSTFTVQAYRASTAVTCSRVCHNTRISKITASARGEKQRYRGERKSYVKLMGRHMHRVVMEQKLGRPLLDGEIVHHIDGNRRNNDPANLMLTNASDHTKIHAPEMAEKRRLVVVVGENVGNSKLTEIQVLEIRSLLKQGLKMAQIGRMFGVTGVNVASIRDRVTWRHLP